MIYKPGRANTNADALSRNLPNAQALPIKLFTRSSENLSRKNADEPQDPNPSHSSGSDNEPLTEEEESTNTPHTIRSARVIETRDNINTVRDNIAVFVTQQGVPCDQGAQILRDAKQLPKIDATLVGKARVLEKGKKYIILLVVKHRNTENTETGILKEAIRALYDVILELGLRTVTLAKGSIDIGWPYIKRLLQTIITGTEISIIACSNEIITPEPKNARGFCMRITLPSSVVTRSD